jgi:putative FmdB family regulatory protein
MPTYEYRCEGCKHEFVLVMSISERETTKVTCPKCQNNNVSQLLSPFIAKTSRKS